MSSISHRYTTPDGSQKPWSGFQMSWLSAEKQARVKEIADRFPGDVEMGALAHWMFTVLRSARFSLDLHNYAVELTKRHRLSTATLLAMQEATKEYEGRQGR